MSDVYRTVRENGARRPAAPHHLAPPLRLRWTIRRTGIHWHSVLVDDGRVFTKGPRDRVLALDEWSGEVLWTSGMRADVRAVHPDGLVVSKQQRGVLAVLDPRTGRPIGKTMNHGGLSVAAVGQELVLATFERNLDWLIARRPGAARAAWRYRLASPRRGDLISLRGLFAVDSDRVVAAVSDGTVFALGTDDGREQWRTSLTDLKSVDDPGQFGLVGGPITLDRGRVILTLTSDHVVALDSLSGRRLWVTPGVADHGYPCDDLYFALREVREILVGLDVASGRRRVQIPLGKSVPRKVREKIFNITGPLLVSSSHYFVGSSGGYVLAFDRKSERLVWHGRPAKGSSTYFAGCHFAAVNGRLYYADQGGAVHCLEEEVATHPALRRAREGAVAGGGRRAGRPTALRKHK